MSAVTNQIVIPTTVGYNYFFQLWLDYIARVEADGGTVEGKELLLDTFRSYG